MTLLQPLPTDGIDGLTGAAVLAAVRRQWGISGGTLVSWRAERIWTPRLASTAGVYRIDGVIEHAASTIASSLILKVISRSGAGDMPFEATLYASGALDDLPAGIRAPRWHGNVDLGMDRVCIWIGLERDDLRDWTIERFGIAARHLGRLTGSTSPSLLALAHQRPVRSFWADSQYLARTVDAFKAAPGSDLVRRAWPDATRRALAATWERRGSVLARAERLPLLLCHGDAQRRNLFARCGESGDTTVAVDWANLSRAAVGLDAATIVHYAVAYFDVAEHDIMAVEDTVLEGYMCGLCDNGVRVDDDLVRFGYAAHLVFGLGPLETGPVLRLALDRSSHAAAEAFYRQPVGAILDRRAALAEHLVPLGEAVIRSPPSLAGSAPPAPADNRPVRAVARP